MTRKMLPISVSAFALLVGCGGVAQNSDSTTEAALDSNEIGSNESAIVVSSADVTVGSTMPANAEEAATRAATNIPLRWKSGCAVVKSSNGATVVYELTDCTGPYGLVHVTGTITVVYAKTIAGFTAHATATGLKVNEATMNLDATGTFSIDLGAVKTLTVTAASSGTGPRGNMITRTGEYTVVWDSTCMTLNGTWSTKVGLLSFTTTVTDLKRCVSGCPTGTIAHIGALGGTTTVVFDGTSTAHWSRTPGGKSGTVQLTCN